MSVGTYGYGSTTFGLVYAEENMWLEISGWVLINGKPNLNDHLVWMINSLAQLLDGVNLAMS